jgi:hypothetical protein
MILDFLFLSYSGLTSRLRGKRFDRLDNSAAIQQATTLEEFQVSTSQRKRFSSVADAPDLGQSRKPYKRGRNSTVAPFQ